MDERMIRREKAGVAILLTLLSDDIVTQSMMFTIDWIESDQGYILEIGEGWSVSVEMSSPDKYWMKILKEGECVVDSLDLDKGFGDEERNLHSSVRELYKHAEYTCMPVEYRKRIDAVRKAERLFVKMRRQFQNRVDVP